MTRRGRWRSGPVVGRVAAMLLARGGRAAAALRPGVRRVRRQLKGDALRLKQVLMNLAGTAAKFTGRDAALAAGMDGFILTPLEPERLADQLGAICAQAARGAVAAQSVDVSTAAGDGECTAEPLIDADRGLRLWRDAEAYRDYLRRFLSMHGDDADRLARLLRRGETDEANFVAHRLCGSASAVALTRVAKYAGALEKCVRQGASTADALTGLCNALDATLAVVADYLAPFEANHETTPTTGAALASRRVKLEALIAALDSDDPGRIEPVLATLSGELPTRDFDTLRRLVADFDFRTAESFAGALRDRSVG